MTVSEGNFPYAFSIRIEMLLCVLKTYIKDFENMIYEYNQQII